MKICEPGTVFPDILPRILVADLDRRFNKSRNEAQRNDGIYPVKNPKWPKIPLAPKIRPIITNDMLAVELVRQNTAQNMQFETWLR